MRLMATSPRYLQLLPEGSVPTTRAVNEHPHTTSVPICWPWWTSPNAWLSNVSPFLLSPCPLPLLPINSLHPPTPTLSLSVLMTMIEFFTSFNARGLEPKTSTPATCSKTSSTVAQSS